MEGNGEQVYESKKWGQVSQQEDLTIDPQSPGKEDAPFKKPLFGAKPVLKRPEKSNVFEKPKPKNETVDKPVKTDIINKDTTEKQKNNNDSGQSKKVAASKLCSALQQKQIEAAGPISYKEPSWASMPEKEYSFEAIKNGVIIDRVKLSEKSYHVVGRLQSCDVTMEHPSLSRYHAVVQYGTYSGPGGGTGTHGPGWYVYDLDSTHGTWVNKNKLIPQTYVRIRVGHVVKFGGSTRLNILQGPQEDRDEESDLSVNEMKQLREKQKKELEILKQAEEVVLEEKRRHLEQVEADKGCSWGIDEATNEEAEEEPSEVNPFSLEQAEELYINDPKKALNGFFEREGLDVPEYVFEDAGIGKHKCAIELPIDNANGHPIIAEVTVSGKKKEAVAACALEACRLLDRHGVLRASTHESRKRRKKDWAEDDFYDSDEDTFLDRTGTIESKRKQRMKKAGQSKEKGATYEALVEKLKQVHDEIQEYQETLDKAKADEAPKDLDELDALDAYMRHIKSGAMDTKTKMRLKRQLFDLRKEEQKLMKLANVAKPVDMPKLKKFEYIPQKEISKLTTKSDSNVLEETSLTRPSQLGVIGKIKKPSQLVRRPVIGPSRPVTMETDGEIVEKDDSEDPNMTVDDENNVTRKTSEKTVPEETDSKTSPEMKTDNEHATPDKDVKICQENKTEKDKNPTVSEQQSPAVQETKRKKPPKLKKSQKKPEDDADYNTSDPNYAVWVPPINQSGDGKTYLNEKYGY